jgi:hypothetical protein
MRVHVHPRALGALVLARVSGVGVCIDGGAFDHMPFVRLLVHSCLIG